MRANQANHPIAVMSRALGVSASGYHAWRVRPPSRRAVLDADLLARIRAIHRDSDGTYGAPRIYRELREQRVRIGKKRVARLMQQAAIAGVSRRKWVTTTVRDEGAAAAPDLCKRDFSASGPDRLWVADISVPQEAA